MMHSDEALRLRYLVSDVLDDFVPIDGPDATKTGRTALESDKMLNLRDLSIAAPIGCVFPDELSQSRDLFDYMWKVWQKRKQLQILCSVVGLCTALD
jgi:hypothetical protein